MAKFNKDTQARIDAVEAEKDLQQNLTETLKKNLDYRTKQGRVAKQLTEDLAKEKSLSSKLTKVLEEKQKIIEGEYNLTKDRKDQILKELEASETLLRKEKKRKDKSAEIKGLQGDLKETMLQQVGLSSDLVDKLFQGGIAVVGLMLLTKVVQYLGDAVKRSIELSKQTGMTAGQTAEYEANLLRAKYSAEGFLYDMDDLRTSAEAIRKQTGDISINPDTVNDITAISKMLGDAEAATALQRSFDSITDDSTALREDIVDIANKAGMDAKVAFEALSSEGGRLNSMTQEQVKLLAQEAMMIKQMGADRQKLVDIASQGLDIEQSLSNQMKLQQLTGENLTSEMEAYRAAQLASDTEGMAQARVDIVKRTADAVAGNYRAQQILLDSLGMERDEYQNILNSKNESAKLSEKIAENQKEESNGMSNIAIIAASISGTLLVVLATLFAISKLGGLGGVLSSTGKGMGMGLKGMAVGLRALVGPALIGLAALTVAIIGIGFALKLAAPGIKAFGDAMGTIIKSLGNALSSIITSIGDVFVKVAQIATPQMALSLMGMAAGFAALSASLATFAVAGLAAIPSMIAVGTFASIGGAELLGGGNDNSNEELVKEIKGLRSDIQSQPILISVDGKVVSEITKAQTRQKSFSRQMGR